MTEAVLEKIHSNFEVRGEINKKDLKTIAIVGSRKITQYGMRVIDYIVEQLVKNNITIVSGLMYGVDLYSHNAAINFGGRTIAVCGYGLDFLDSVSYAQEFCNRLEQGSYGAIISEYPNDQNATKWTFPKRNKSIVDISDGVIVIEASEKSGSLITVSHALDQGKPIFAVPGSIFSEQSRGTNNLIYQGAEILIDPNQILDVVYGIDSKKTPKRSFEDLIRGREFADNEKIVLKFIYDAANTDEYIDLDVLCEKTGITPIEISQIVSSLELKNAIKRTSTGWFSIVI